MAFHGIKVNEEDKLVPSVTDVTSGIPFVVGTCPVHLAESGEVLVNTPVLVRNMEEAKKKLGYSEDFDKYTACEVMYTSFQLFGVSPVIFVNVLDPAKHAKAFAKQSVTVDKMQAVVPVEGALKDGLKVTADSTVLTEGTDYILSRKDEKVCITLLSDGKAADTLTVEVEGKQVDPSLVTEEDIVGGYNAEDGTESGLELIRQVYPRFGLTVGTIVVPKYSKKKAVAAVIEAKCEEINGVFRADAVVDLDASACTKYTDVRTAKDALRVSSEHTLVLWPKVKVGDLVLHASSVAAALVQYMDQQYDGVPSRSPSNQDAKIDAAVLDDGTEVMLDFVTASAVNDEGVATFINANGWVLWGNETAAYPRNTNQKAKFWCARRFFTWRTNYFIVKYIRCIDSTANRKLIESICDEENMACNGLVSSGVCASASIEFRDEDNTVETLAGGILVFRQTFGLFGPAKTIYNTLVVDLDSVVEALGGATNE